ncbi:hypothetical protein MTR67_053027 [Solanum verrucosum]|uniref:Uncharacterized protein n=1 Tax=Solanum verrucosum TaxID=315347 RepID=A0AAF1A0G2_SOLVR|nr:hypothetical protein MTR67_053027 [Solanum verrucosum]
MPNYGRERLNARFLITIDKTQFLELTNFNNTTQFKNAQFRGFMRNYEHELLNSRTQRYFSSQDCSTYRVHLGHEDITPLMDTQLMEFMRNYGHGRLDSKGYITLWNSCIRPFSFSYLLSQNLTQVDYGSQRIHN